MHFMPSIKLLHILALGCHPLVQRNVSDINHIFLISHYCNFMLVNFKYFTILIF